MLLTGIRFRIQICLFVLVCLPLTEAINDNMGKVNLSVTEVIHFLRAAGGELAQLRSLEKGFEKMIAKTVSSISKVS